MSEIDRLRIELANKELADEKIKLKNKKEEEKNNLMQIIKQKEIKESQKSSVRLKDKEQEKKILIEQDSVLLKQEQDRISHYASIKDRLVLQEERVKNTSEYYKSHNKNYQDTVSVISQLNEINLKRKKNHSNCKDATLKKEYQMNDNPVITNKREKQQQETNEILKKQVEEKFEKKKLEKLENLDFKIKINDYYKKFNQEKKNEETINKDKLIKYKAELEKQLHNSVSTNGIPRINIKDQKTNLIPEVIKCVLQKLRLIGENALLRLDSLLKLFDKDQKGEIDFIDFARLMKDFGLTDNIDIKKDDLLFKIYTIYVDELKPKEVIIVKTFIDSLKPKLSQKRILLLKKIYNIINGLNYKKFYKSQLNLDGIKLFLKGVNREGSSLPLEMFSSEEILQDLIDSWESFCSIDKQISEVDFIAFYSYVSPFIEYDEEFEWLIRNSYKLSIEEFNQNNLSNSKKELKLPAINKEVKLKSFPFNLVPLLKNIRKRSYMSQGPLCIVKIKNFSLQISNEISTFDGFLTRLEKEMKLGLGENDILTLKEACNSDSLNVAISNFLKLLISPNVIDNKNKTTSNEFYYKLIHLKEASSIAYDDLNLLKKQGLISLEKLNSDDLECNLPKISLDYLYSQFKSEIHPFVLIDKKKDFEISREYQQLFAFHFPDYDKTFRNDIFTDFKTLSSFLSHISLTLEESNSYFSSWCEQCFGTSSKKKGK